MTSLAQALPDEINRVRKLKELFLALRHTDGVLVEPQLMMIEAAIERGFAALGSGCVVTMLQAHAELKGFTE